MKALIEIHEQYTSQFEQFIQTLPKEAVKVTPIKSRLDIEIDKRIEEIKRGEVHTLPFEHGLDKIRQKLVAQI